MKDSEIKIVLIGGDKAQYELLCEVLAGLENGPYHLAWSASYKGGLAYARKDQPDLFLVNYGLGDQRGLDFMAEIRKNDCVKPVILLADKYDYVAERKAEKAGVDLYLERTIDNPLKLESAILGTIERVNALEAIRKSESRMRGIFYWASIGISLIDLDRLIVQGNPALCNIVGYDSEQLCAMDIADDFAHTESVALIREKFHELANRNISHANIECRYRRKDGKWIWVQLTLSLFSETDAPPQFVIGLIEDISEKKTAQIALALSEVQLKELSGQLVEVQEREQRRMSMELHDSIGGNLAAIKYMLEKMKIQADTSPAAYLKAINQVEAQVIETMDEVQRISAELYPRILSDLGLLPAIRWLVRKHNELYSEIGTTVNIEIEEPCVPNDLKTIIFRLLQEALNNAAQHSRATRVDVDLKEQDAKIILSVRDNGSGFSMDLIENREEPKGMGLRNMIKRAELTGGCMQIESELGKGTHVHTEWPLIKGEVTPIPL